MPQQPATPTPSCTTETHEADHDTTAPPGILDVFATIDDPRDPRGRRHTLTTILALAACASTAGARTLQEITEWSHDLTEPLATALNIRYDLIKATFTPPSLPTFERVFASLHVQDLETALTTWICAHTPQEEHEGIAVDGKAMRGSTDDDAPMVHLLSALSHTHRTVLAQQRVPDKTNEIPGFTELLSCLDPDLLQGAVITADAMHSQCEAAEFLHQRGAHYLFYAAGNQPGLFAAIDALDWEHTPSAHTTHQSRRGRREKRTIQVLPAPRDLRFPHAAQVFLIERYTYDKHGDMVRACAALGVTSMSSAIADGQRLLTYNRGQWSIENPLHWVRDVVYREDAHRLRKGNAPQVMACFRNLGISALRLVGHGGIASAARHHHRRPERPFQTLGIPH